jgi:hypothetical protein
MRQRTTLQPSRDPRADVGVPSRDLKQARVAVATVAAFRSGTAEMTSHAADVVPFRVSVPQAYLDDLRHRLDVVRWPEPTKASSTSQSVSASSQEKSFACRAAGPIKSIRTSFTGTNSTRAATSQRSNNQHFSRRSCATVFEPCAGPNNGGAYHAEPSCLTRRVVEGAA